MLVEFKEKKIFIFHFAVCAISYYTRKLSKLPSWQDEGGSCNIVFAVSRSDYIICVPISVGNNVKSGKKWEKITRRKKK